MAIKKKLKKLLTTSALAITSLSLVLSPTTSYASTSKFSDVSKNHWAYDSIVEAHERGIVNGYPNGKFGPNDPLTYEQFMTMLGNMFSNYEFIEDRWSGCNAYISDTKETSKVSKGDFIKAYNTRVDFYKENKIYDVLTKNSDYIAENNLGFYFNSSCPELSWDEFTVSPYGGTFIPNPVFVSDKLQKYAVDNLVEVPYLSSIINHYSLLADNGKHVKDLGLNNKNVLIQDLYKQYELGNYEIHEKLTERYAYYGVGSKKITREDMAIILYTFLDYENKKLLSSYQDSWNFNEDFYDLQGKLKFRNFKSTYSDIPKYFIADSYDNTAFPYKHGVIQVKDFTLNNKKQKDRYLMFNTLPMTSRGAILAVSDTKLKNGQALLNGSNGKFRPKDNLTRAQGVVVTLRLEEYLKERYNLIERKEGTLAKKINEINEINESKKPTVKEESNNVTKEFTKDDLEFLQPENNPENKEYIIFDANGNKMTVDEYLERLNKHFNN